MLEFDPVLVHDWLTRSARRFPHKTALVCAQERWTYKALDRYTTHFAHALMRMGLKRHDRVVILLNNSSETVISLYATLKAGGCFIILADSVKETTFRYILNDSGANIFITHTSKADVVENVMDTEIQGKQIIWVGATKAIPEPLIARSLRWDDIVMTVPNKADCAIATCSYVRSIDIDLAALIYTSDSLNKPKGIMSTHHNMVSAARSIIQYIGNSQDDIILNALPLSFDYGLYQIIMAVMFCGTVVLEQSFLNMHNLLELIKSEQIKGFPIIPTTVAMLLKMQNLNDYDFDTLRYMTNTGAVLPVEHIRKLGQLFPNVNLISMFGLAECKRVSYLPPDQLSLRPDSVGKAMSNCEVFVVDGQGNELGPGQTGELVIRGSNVMQGYWDDPKLTSRSYHVGCYADDRLLYSGHYFRTDEQGYLYFKGPKNDMIKTRSKRISAKEVEDIIHCIDGIAEVAVIGVPDDTLGQAIKAFVILSPGVWFNEKHILKCCNDKLKAFMVPRQVVVLDELPKTPNGKIDKKKLGSMKTDQYVN
jgi:long-chain acyl-CoA synthetase